MAERDAKTPEGTVDRPFGTRQALERGVLDAQLAALDHPFEEALARAFAACGTAIESLGP